MNLSDLKSIFIFEDVSEQYLKMVTPEMSRTFYDGDVIFNKEENKRDLMILTRGQVCVYSGDTFIVPRAAPTIIGEQALIDQIERSATVKAQGLVNALVIPADVAERLFEDPAFNRNLLKVLSAKLREATEDRAVHYKNEKLLFGEFRAHVSPEITDRLLATGINYGAPRFIENAVILLSDIRSFTDLSAGMTPEEIAAQLSPYLSKIVDVIHRHGGVVDKFIGDAVLAFWGFVESENLERKAFECAVEMVEVAARCEFGGKPIVIGAGLNQGKVFVGNVGSDGKRQFTVLGTPVNLAARYESKSKELGSPIVIGESLYNRLPSEIQELLKTHLDQEIKGAEKQTLYSFNPLTGGQISE